MPTYTLPEDINSAGGLEWVFNYMGRNVDWFSTALLVFVFAVIVSSGYFAQERRKGSGNLPMWFAIASFITTAGSFILYLIPEPLVVISIETVATSTAICFVSAMWFLIDNSGN